MSTPPKPQPKFFTVTEAADRLGIDPSTVRRHIAAGSFPDARRTSPVGGNYRIPEEDIIQFEKQRENL